MTPSQVRAALLGEHFTLRGLIEEARAVFQSGSGTATTLRAAILSLADALHEHSQHEEEALRIILKPQNARPPGRNAVMDEEHVAAHARLVTVLRDACSSPDPFQSRASVDEVLNDLESHMTLEEEVLLAEDLLADHGDAN